MNSGAFMRLFRLLPTKIVTTPPAANEIEVSDCQSTIRLDSLFTATLSVPLALYVNYGRGINSLDARGVVQIPSQSRLAPTDLTRRVCPQASSDSP